MVLSRIRSIVRTICEKKGGNVVVFDVRGLSSITDYILLAEGNVERHVVVLAKEVEGFMRGLGQKAFCTEGLQDGDWVVLDYSQIVIHLLIPGMRKKYQLDNLWQTGRIMRFD